MTEYKTEWSEEDGEFVATCGDYPSLSWLAPTEGEALLGICNLVRMENEKSERYKEEQMIAITKEESDTIRDHLDELRIYMNNQPGVNYSYKPLKDKFDSIYWISCSLEDKTNKLE